MNRVNGPRRERNTPRQRNRILFDDANTISTRIQDAAAPHQLTGAKARVLRVVLRMLCGWSRISDDFVRIDQIIDQLDPEHRHDPKTVGRVLKLLDGLELIRYTPAQGRGKRATIAIHPRFLDGITELKRDDDGKVITFSAPSPITSQREVPHSDRESTDDLGERPTEVEIDSKDVRTVFGLLSDGPINTLPTNLRWCLSGEIRKYLARGYRPEQIAAILNAPMPTAVDRPFRLAKWRLVQNMVGAGPRLKPLQAAWDRAHKAAEQSVATSSDDRLDTEIQAHTSPSLRSRMLAAMSRKVRGGIINELAALRQSARIARRHSPADTSLLDAIQHWLADIEPDMPEPAAAAPESGCMLCGESGPIRHELPVPVAICDNCWEIPGDVEAA